MMNNKTILTSLVAGAMMLSATVANAADMLSTHDKMFLKTVSAANHAEIAAAKIALKKSSDSKVRGVAETILKDHSAAQMEVVDLAKKNKVSIPMAPDANHKAMARRLSDLRGNAFDNAYINGQIKDHMAAIKLFKSEMAKGKSSEVRDFATQTLGHIQMHNDMIIKVAGKSPNMSLMHTSKHSKM